jgi:hypothetical protein
MKILVICIIVLLIYMYRSSTKILSIYIVEDDEELEYFCKNVKPKYMEYNKGTVDLYLCQWENNQFKLLEPYTQELNTGDWISFLATLMRKYPCVDGLIYSGHSSGDHIGSMDFPMMTTPVLATELRKLGCKLDFMYFDSCNMGTLPWVNHFDGVAEYVIGTPNYYEWKSILELPGIYNLNMIASSSMREKRLKRMIQEYTDSGNGKPELLEIGMYHPPSAKKLWRFMKHVENNLIIDENSVIEEDIFDVRRLLKNSLKQLSPNQINQAHELINSTIIFRSRCIHESDVPPSYLGIQFINIDHG